MSVESAELLRTSGGVCGEREGVELELEVLECRNEGNRVDVDVDDLELTVEAMDLEELDREAE
jgi:hypothetical protein